MNEWKERFRKSELAWLIALIGFAIIILVSLWLLSGCAAGGGYVEGWEPASPPAQPKPVLSQGYIGLGANRTPYQITTWPSGYSQGWIGNRPVSGVNQSY